LIGGAYQRKESAAFEASYILAQRIAKAENPI
jgi:hypothetical protein